MSTVSTVRHEGAPPTQPTEVWIGFDDENVYVSARAWDSAPESEWVANEMRRDTNQLRQNAFTVFLDTFYDRRNGYNFYTNPLGARVDQQFVNENNPNNDWNPVWDVRTGRFDGRHQSFDRFCDRIVAGNVDPVRHGRTRGQTDDHRRHALRAMVAFERPSCAMRSLMRMP